MAKVLKCADVTGTCPEVIRGQTEDEVLRAAAQHAKEQHGMATLPPDVAAKVKASIRDA
jgi:predicted small metal-binding protein